MSQHRWRFLLIAIAGLSMLAGVWVGLLRLGWELPRPGVPFPSAHGPLMISGFLGTLIGLERAAALEKRWPYGAPFFSALSIAATFIWPASNLAPLLAAAGSLFLISIFILLYRQHPGGFFVAMATAAVLWMAGNFLWQAGRPLHEAVPWWAGFLVLMIAGERLELSRVRRLSPWVSAKFILSAALLVSGIAFSLATFAAGVKLCGGGLIALGLWLLRYDIASLNLFEPGLPRFMASALLTGYVWLVFAGALWIFFAADFTAGSRYDAMLHAIFLGFVFSMIFAHAPIIFPSITGVAMPFQRAFYAHLLLLHLSLALRVGGDLAESAPLQQWGAMVNALSILLFLANNARAIRLARRA